MTFRARRVAIRHRDARLASCSLFPHAGFCRARRVSLRPAPRHTVRAEHAFQSGTQHYAESLALLPVPSVAQEKSRGQRRSIRHDRFWWIFLVSINVGFCSLLVRVSTHPPGAVSDNALSHIQVYVLPSLRKNLARRVCCSEITQTHC